jgi:hypothetical protein
MSLIAIAFTDRACVVQCPWSGYRDCLSFTAPGVWPPNNHYRIAPKPPPTTITG